MLKSIEDMMEERRGKTSERELIERVCQFVKSAVMHQKQEEGDLDFSETTGATAAASGVSEAE